MPRNGRRYPPEFRQQMVELVRSEGIQDHWHGSSNRLTNRSATGLRRPIGMRGAVKTV